MSLQESSLTRLYQHNTTYDCGALTAWRDKAACGMGDKYTRDENRKRNRSLLAKLQSLSYNVTSIKGRYPEAGIVLFEESFFVVDHKRRGTLEADLRRLGEMFEQDSILFIPKGTITREAKAFLFGTNRCDNNWLSYGEKKVFDVGRLGHETPIYTSYVNGRPFIFEEVGQTYLTPSTGFGWWGLRLRAEQHWTSMPLPPEE